MTQATNLTQNIVTLHLENHTTREIAKKVGISHFEVWKILQSAGIGYDGHGCRAVFKETLKSRQTQEQKFWERVGRTSDENECWPWLLTPNNNGYGRFYAVGRHRYSHQWAFIWANRKFPKLWVLHRCGNATCCNPNHLYEGTPKENSADRQRHSIEKTGQPYQRGMRWRSQRRKLTGTRVAEIKSAAGTKSQRQIAEEYGVCQGTISRIIRGLAYTDC